MRETVVAIAWFLIFIGIAAYLALSGRIFGESTKPAISYWPMTSMCRLPYGVSGRLWHWS